MKPRINRILEAQKRFDAEVHATKAEIDGLELHQQLTVLLGTFNGQHTVTARNKVVSYKTMHNRKIDIKLFMQIVVDIFRLKNIYNLQERHYIAVVEKYLAMEPHYKPGSVANFLTNTRILYRWIGKAHLLKDKKSEYVADKSRLKVPEVAVRDKSWAAKRIVPDDLIAVVMNDHPKEGLTLRLMQAFGMRFKEAICFKPHTNIYADGTAIMLVDGTKGARTRVMQIESDFQRQVLEEVKKAVKRPHTFIMETYSRDLQANIQRFYYICRKYGISKNGYGITCHGLRHEFVNDKLESKGLISPVRGGDPKEFFAKENRYIRVELAQMTGHNRPKVTGRYCGGKAGKVCKKATKPHVGSKPTASREGKYKRRRGGLRRAIKTLRNAKRIRELSEAIHNQIL